MTYLTRITFNSNNWLLPSGRHDKCPGTNLFEAIHGFGFEEWWRNENFRLVEDGKVYQYGFLQSLNVLHVDPRDLDIVYLYTRYKKQDRIVAKLTNVVVLDQCNQCIELKECFENGLKIVEENIINSLGKSSQEIFKIGPTTSKKNVKRCYFNFKVEINNIEFYGWENGHSVRPSSYYFKLLTL
jgi:hypothetical protein